MEQKQKIGAKPLHGHRIRGIQRSAEYLCWDRTIQKCTNPKNSRYKYYGARGRRVCKRWMGANGFLNFLTDMGKKPSPAHSLDRFPNTKKVYNKANCRWATAIEQQNNRSDNVLIKFNGSIKTVSEWSKLKGIPKTTIYSRLKVGTPTKNLFTKQKRGQPKKIKFTQQKK